MRAEDLVLQRLQESVDLTLLLPQALIRRCLGGFAVTCSYVFPSCGASEATVQEYLLRSTRTRTVGGRPFHKVRVLLVRVTSSAFYILAAASSNFKARQLPHLMATDSYFLSTLQAMSSYPPPRTPRPGTPHYVSPRERVVPSHLAHHSWLGWGAPSHQADVSSTVPSPCWGLRSSDVKGYIGPPPGSDFEETRFVPSPTTLMSPRTRLPPVSHGDIKGRILALERVKLHHASHGLLRERQHKTPGFLQLHPMVSPTRRPWRVAGLPMTTSPRIDAPPTRPPVQASIFDDD